MNFYTYQGTVQAIEGIDLNILKGETLGLVGETGCGKSVTANTIMKLILSPPGKIEALKDDLIAVLSRHIEIDVRAVHIELTHDRDQQRLVADIPLASARARRRPLG